MYELTKREELLLLTILRLEHEAYLTALRKRIKDFNRKTISYGSLCNTLSALVRKGYLNSQESDPVHRPGGRRKVLYSLTFEGKRALLQSYKAQQRAWDGLVKMIVQNS